MYKRNLEESWRNHFLPLKSNRYYIFWVCVCNLSYPACNAHAPYCHLWAARLYKIFHTLSHKWHDYLGKVI